MCTESCCCLCSSTDKLLLELEVVFIKKQVLNPHHREVLQSSSILWMEYINSYYLI